MSALMFLMTAALLLLTCWVVCVCAGNYYSLRSQHEKAVLYFQRALKLNPNYLSAWTLMGHEYMELKQTSAAIQAYRQAIGLLMRALLLLFMGKPRAVFFITWCPLVMESHGI